MVLGKVRGKFYRCATTGCLNLLLTYPNGCTSNCSYCGLGREREKGDSFIRVDWPEYPTEEVIGRARGRFHRVCVSMLTHPHALRDTTALVEAFRERAPMSTSVLLSAQNIRRREQLEELRGAGADHLTVALDSATERLFNRLRGRAVRGGLDWDHYWKVLDWCSEVVPDGAGVHLIAGLGETEREMTETMQRAWDAGAPTHLFAFFPEPGTPMADARPPSFGQYRRIQAARWLINHDLSRADAMKFDRRGRLVDFGVGDAVRLLADGRAFMTSGCPDGGGEVACNRPFGNERPGPVLKNYPFRPEREEVGHALRQMREK